MADRDSELIFERVRFGPMPRLVSPLRRAGDSGWRDRGLVCPDSRVGLGNLRRPKGMFGFLTVCPVSLFSGERESQDCQAITNFFW